jgi:hypothetical protein
LTEFAEDKLTARASNATTEIDKETKEMNCSPGFGSFHMLQQNV